MKTPATEKLLGCIERWVGELGHQWTADDEDYNEAARLLRIKSPNYAIEVAMGFALRNSDPLKDGQTFYWALTSHEELADAGLEHFRQLGIGLYDEATWDFSDRAPLNDAPWIGKSGLAEPPPWVGCSRIALEEVSAVAPSKRSSNAPLRIILAKQELPKSNLSDNGDATTRKRRPLSDSRGVLEDIDEVLPPAEKHSANAASEYVETWDEIKADIARFKHRGSKIDTRNIRRWFNSQKIQYEVGHGRGAEVRVLRSALDRLFVPKCWCDRCNTRREAAMTATGA